MHGAPRARWPDKHDGHGENHYMQRNRVENAEILSKLNNTRWGVSDNHSRMVT